MKGTSLLFRLSSPRFAGGGAGKPKWTISKEHMWHPQIPDRQFYGEHPTYNGFVLWLRGIRPYLEKIFADTYKTGKRIILGVYSPVTSFVKSHNPDIRLQFVALLSFATTSSYLTGFFGNYYQSLVDISNLIELGAAKDLDTQGFWQSQSEDTEKRLQDYAEDQGRLTELWEKALADATMSRSFDSFIQHLKVDEASVPIGVPLPISWRFNMLPYGQNNPDTKTFPAASHEQPLRSFALNFTYNNLSGNWGDYIERKDNKSSILRPARQLFADVYIPGTK